MRFSRGEQEFLRRHDLCVLATLRGRAPHAVPVSYMFFEGSIWIPAECGSRKCRNILSDDRVAVVVYTHHPDRGVMVRGRARLVDSGREYERAYRRYHQNPHHEWREKEELFIRVVPTSKASWRDNRPKIRNARAAWTKHNL